MITTRERLRTLLAENPVRTLRSLAQEVGVSHEHVRRICAEEGLARTTPVMPLIETYCQDCNLLLPPKTYGLRCESCREKMIRARITTLTCATCGKEFERATCDVKFANKAYDNPKTFCSNQCMGRYTGKVYGFAVHDGYKKAQEARKAKTHCPQGHAYAEKNTYVHLTTGGRHCKSCTRRRSLERYHRNKARAQ